MPLPLLGKSSILKMCDKCPSKVFAAAGHPNAVFGISYSELKRLTNAETDDLTE